jgi:hypothetical protein
LAVLGELLVGFEYLRPLEASSKVGSNSWASANAEIKNIDRNNKETYFMFIPSISIDLKNVILKENPLLRHKMKHS